MINPMRFDDWIALLNARAEMTGYHDKPLTGVNSITATTGVEAWREYYDLGLTPAEALQANARVG